ncbi:MAG: matrixin family metalloprotease [Armatimonadota bacterium]
MRIYTKLWAVAGLLGLLTSHAHISSDIFEMAGLNRLLPHWAPIWSWDNPTPPWNPLNSMTARHALLSELTGVRGVGSCCIEGVNREGLAMHVCFAPGTPEWYVRYISRLIFGDFSPAYDIGGRWTSTSYGTTGSQGTPIRLRWSIVPDGTLVPGVSGGSAPSNLISSMNSKFGGNTTLWQNQFRNSFARWAQVAGLVYEEVSDDGAAFPNSPGSATAPRGDVRIGGRNLDGAGGVLAFNYLPNTGDMVLDTSENWQSSSGSYRFLRNTVMHEHGHGIGLLHVVPINGTKLMEPYLNTGFDGPQDDDIRGAHRNYGDPYEVNGTAATATPIDLTSTNLVTLNTPSLDRTADVDFYRLTVPPSRRITITVTPIGSTYQVGGEDGNPPQTTIDTRAIQNLQVELRASNGTTVLASATANGTGVAEQIANFVLYPAGGTFYVRVFSGSGSTNDVQRYELRLQTTTLPGGDVDGSGCVDDADLLAVLFNFGGSDPRYDLNGDGIVDDADLLTVLFNFGSGC